MVDFRWYRGETKRVSIQGPLYVLQTAVAVQFVLIFGRGIPDNTCCFEVRTAAEYLTPACGEATLTGLGTADIVLAASQARYGVRLWNKSTTAAEVIYLFDSTHGALGFPLSNGDSIFLAWPESTMEIRAEAASGTPKIGYMTETK